MLLLAPSDVTVFMEGSFEREGLADHWVVVVRSPFVLDLHCMAAYSLIPVLKRLVIFQELYVIKSTHARCFFAYPVSDSNY